MITATQAAAFIANADPRRHYAELCLPCMHGEHQACRKTGDGPRFSRDYSEPCLCMVARHSYGLTTCRAWVMADWGSGHPCGRKAKGTLMARARFARSRSKVEIPACGSHLAHERKRQERDAAWAERRRSEDQEREEGKRRCRVVDDVIELFSRLDLGDGRAIAAAHTHGPYENCDGRVALDPEVARAIAMRLIEQEEWK